MGKEDCIFCKIVAGEIPSNTIYEDEMFRVILDLAPAAKGHALILPKAHCADIYEIDEEVAGRAMKLAKSWRFTWQGSSDVTDLIFCRITARWLDRRYSISICT